MQNPWRLLCSTGAFTRDPDRTDYRPILDDGPHLDVDGFEVLFYSSWYPAQKAIAASLSASGLAFPAIHTEKHIGPLLGSGQPADRAEALRRLAANCAFAGEIGARLAILHLWGLPTADDCIANNLAALGDCLAVVEDHGLELALETVPCRRADPLSHIRRALEQDGRVCIALDTEFLAHHAQLDAALAADWLWARGRVRHIHIKDYDGSLLGPDGRRRYLHPGEGHLDFTRLFATLGEHGFCGSVSLEAPAVDAGGAVHGECIRRSLALLRRYQNPCLPSRIGRG